MYSVDNSSEIKTEQKIEILFSNSYHIKKPTSECIRKEVKKMQRRTEKIANVPINGLKYRIEKGELCFPGCSAEGFLQIQVYFVDFDNKAKAYVSKKDALKYLEKIRFLPNLVYDTYSSTKDCNRFRIGYILTEPIKDLDTAKHIRKILWEILDKINPDTNFNTISGIMFGGCNCKIIHKDYFSVEAIVETHKRVVRKFRQGKTHQQQTVMLPTAKGYSYALNLIDANTYDCVKKSTKSCLRLLKAGSDPYRMEFSDNIADINLNILKAVYTLHMKNETHCIDEKTCLYEVSVATLGRFLNKNLYSQNCKTLKLTLEQYENIFACINENTMFNAFKGKLDGTVIHYNGKYFNFLKSELFEKSGDTKPLERTHNLMLMSSAFGGNYYGELLAEQLMQSVIRAGNLKKYSGIMLSTLINRVPQFKCKLESLKTVNMKNTYMKRAFNAMLNTIYNNSSFNRVYADWIITMPSVSTKKLYNKVLLTLTTDEDKKIEAFLQDMI